MNTPANTAPYPTDPIKLKEACERYDQLLAEKDLQGFYRVDFFDVAEIRAILDLCQSEHAKIYYGIDETGRHFLFMAPTQADGRARDDVDTTVAPCCCQIPPCPQDEDDRYTSM